MKISISCTVCVELYLPRNDQVILNYHKTYLEVDKKLFGSRQIGICNKQRDKQPIGNIHLGILFYLFTYSTIFMHEQLANVF